MLQSTGGVSIDRFDGGPDRLANSCKHPPSQHRLLYLYLCLYKIQKDRLANCCKYSPPLIRLPHKRVFTFRLALLGLLSHFDCKHPPPVVTSSLYHICVWNTKKTDWPTVEYTPLLFNTSCFNYIFVLIQKIQVGQLFQKNPVSNQQQLAASLLNHQFFSWFPSRTKS